MTTTTGEERPLLRIAVMGPASAAAWNADVERLRRFVEARRLLELVADVAKLQTLEELLP